MILAATGHRPHKLGGYGDDVFERLVKLARDYLVSERPTSVITGMALGWDQAVAQASLDLAISITAAIPFEGQESRWPPESQRRYYRLLGQVREMQVISEFPGTRAMQSRNEWMVDRADRIVALWDGTFGGTFNCLQYARRQGKPVTNLWSRWDTDLSDLLV